MKISKKFPVNKKLTSAKIGEALDIALEDNFADLLDGDGCDIICVPSDGKISVGLKNVYLDIMEMYYEDKKAIIKIKTRNKANGLFYIAALSCAIVPSFFVIFVLWWMMSNSKCNKAIKNAMEDVELYL